MQGEVLLPLPGDDPDGVDDAGEVAEEGEQQADPELDLQGRSTLTNQTSS